MGYGGARNPPHIPKGCVSETLYLTLRAPYFYPDSLESKTHTEVAVWNFAKRRPGSYVGKAVVLWEETGMGTTGAAGVGV